jgi:AcrR family transcriptional regulator
VIDVIFVDRGRGQRGITGFHRTELGPRQFDSGADDWTHSPIIYHGCVEHKTPETGSARHRFPRREQAAARTRSALIQAAEELFVRDGYLQTSVSAIAERAGVGRATVFTSVPGGKPELLALARDAAIAGDDEPVPVPQRPWFLHAMAATDPHELIRRQARNYRTIQERAAYLEHALVVGAADAPELAELEETARVQRARGARLVVDRLIELGAIPRGRASAAADTLYALASPDIYLLLTRDRGWSGARYEKWLAATLIAVLIS